MSAYIDRSRRHTPRMPPATARAARAAKVRAGMAEEPHLTRYAPPCAACHRNLPHRP